MDDVLTFHRYRLIRRIARGGMAEVFLAAHRGAAGFERKVALKKILPVYSGMEEFASLFRDEARISAALDHSGIVQVYDFGQHGGEYYIAMEYVDGPDLEEVVDRCRRRGVLPPVEVVLYIAHRLASCLEYAHSRVDGKDRPLKIIHRDVSPPNVLIGVQGEIKLTDFGVAKAEFRDSMTRPGVLRGKYAYMSPEQVGHKAIDQRSDIFSLGTVLYETLTGVNPFEGSTDYQTIESVGRAEVEPAGFLRPDTPAELDRILITCLEPDPAHRFQNAAALRQDLARLMLAWPRADDPQCLIDFLRDVFPERAAQDTRAALVDGSVPVWEALAHRLSPMLVSIPTPPELQASEPIRLVPRPPSGEAGAAPVAEARPSALDEPPWPVVASEMSADRPPKKPPESTASNAVMREVGPKARRKASRPFEHRGRPGEDDLGTDPGSKVPLRGGPRAAFLPPVEESLDRIPAVDVHVLGADDSETFSMNDEEPIVPPPFHSLAERGDPLLEGLNSLPPTTADGVPIVNEWELEEHDWSGAHPIAEPLQSDPTRRAAQPEGKSTDPQRFAPMTSLDRVEEVQQGAPVGFVPEPDEVIAADPVGVASDSVGVLDEVLNPPDSSLPDPVSLEDLIGGAAGAAGGRAEPQDYLSPDGDSIEGWDVPTAEGDEALADLLARATSGGTRPNAPAWGEAEPDLPQRIDHVEPPHSPRPPRTNTDPGRSARHAISAGDHPAVRRTNPAGAPLDPAPPHFGRVARSPVPKAAISFSALPPVDLPVEDLQPEPDGLTPPSISFAGAPTPGPAFQSFDPPSSPALRAVHGFSGPSGPKVDRIDADRSPTDRPRRALPAGRRDRRPPADDVEAPPLRQGRPPRPVYVSTPSMRAISVADIPRGVATVTPPAAPEEPAAESRPARASESEPEKKKKKKAGPTLFDTLHEHRVTILYGAIAILAPLLLLFFAGRIGGGSDVEPLEPEAGEQEDEAPRRIEPLEPL